MNSLKIATLLTFGFFAAGSAGAAERQYNLISPTAAVGSAINFAIGYTLGTHDGKANAATGSLRLDSSAVNLIATQVDVPIAQITTGNEKRDCHTRESLGLDYAKANYPANHVCNSDNVIPASGDDAIVYPAMHFTFSHFVGAPSAASIEAGGQATATVAGTIEIHGVKKEIEVPLTLSIPANQADMLRVETSFNIELPDFGMVVKKFLFVDVKTTAKVTLNLLFQAQP